jgi:hypothetical protein
MSTLLEKFEIVASGCYDQFKQQMYDLYKDRAESDIETFDCMADMEQHIRGLEFRRMGAQIKLDKINSESTDAILTVGSAKDLENDEIGIQSSDDRKYNANLWACKFDIYNLRIKAIKEVYKDLHKKQYIPYGKADPNSGIAKRKAVKHWNKTMEQDVQSQIANTLAVKH